MAPFSFPALALALTATTLAIPPPSPGCHRVNDDLVCDHPVPVTFRAPAPPSSSSTPPPSLPSRCFYVGGQLVCRPPVARAVPTLTPSLSAKVLIPLINAVPGPVHIDNLAALVIDGGARPAEPQHAPASEYVDGIPRLHWEEKERAWREDGIIVDFKYLGSEDEERGEEEVQKRELGDCKPGSWGC